MGKGQGFVQSHLEILQGQNMHSLSGQPLPVYNCPNCEKGFLIFSWIFPISSFIPKMGLKRPVFRNKSDLYLLHCKGIPLFIVQIFL